MLKAINGPYDDADPHSTGVREFVAQGGAHAVVIWAPSWPTLQPTPGPYDEQAWASFDHQIANAQQDRLATYVAVASQSPPWAIVGRGRNAKQGRVAPDDLRPQGPWASYIEQVLRRHPHVRGVIPLNEPNLGFLEDPAGMIACTATMIRTAAGVWARNHASPLLLVPAIADLPDGSGWASAKYFANGVLRDLRRWQGLRRWSPPRGVRIGWAHHPYHDVRAGTTQGTRDALNLLAQYRWPGGQKIWMTEGGYEYRTHMTSTEWFYAYDLPLAAQQDEQLRGVLKHYRFCENSGAVELWANYMYRDSPWGSGGWMSGMIALDGSEHPLHDAWLHL